MKIALLLSATGLLLTQASYGAYMASGLPTDGGIGPASQTVGFIYGSAFNISNGGFFVPGVALHTGNTPGFLQAHDVTIWKLNGSTYVPVDTVNFTAGVVNPPGSPTIEGRPFAALNFASTLQLGNGDYFIGYSNADQGDNFLRMSPTVVTADPPNDPLSSAQGANIGATTFDMKETIPGFSFTGIGTIAISSLNGTGGFTPVTTGTGQNVRYGNFGNLSVFADLIAVPEVGSSLMGALLMGMAVSYRRRK